MAILTRPNDICVPVTQPRKSFIARLSHMIAVSRQRHALRNLDDHLLADIGVSNAQAACEASRPAWDVPANWRK